MRAYTRDSIAGLKFPTKLLGFSYKMNFARASILRTLLKQNHRSRRKL
jgi:hypothetical protein